MGATRERIGFVGLGTMGEPMAGHLLSSGANLTVWNRSAGKSNRLASQGAAIAGSLRELGEASDVVCLCVNRTEDVEACIDELAQASKPGALFIDHSTIAPAAAVRIQEQLASVGIGFVDAPITGGSVGAQKGQLTVFCGGDERDVQRAIAVIAPYSKRAERVGGPGSGQSMKLANQAAVAGSLLALCESLAFAARAGLDLEQARSMIGGGAGGSWAFENYGPKVLNRDWTPGFSVKNQRKDLAYCIESAGALRMSLPGVELVDRLLAILSEAGRGEEATAALFDVLSGEAG